MTREELCSELKAHFKKCDEIKVRINRLSAVQVSNKDLRDEIDHISTKWFELSKQIKPFFSNNNEILEKYNSAFRSLLELCGGKNRRSSYLKQFNIICKNYYSEIIVFMQADAEEIETTDEEGFEAEIKSLLDKIKDKDENTYLKEAIGCWKHDYKKAAMVLLWCAAIDRIHKIIEQIGFEKFNKTSEDMKAQNHGRYKNFNKNQNVRSLSDLRDVPDGDVLWIIEGMGLIDCNQKARLASCYQMRCHAGHPGAAPITKYNIISCLSDIVEIVLANPTFEIKGTSSTEKSEK